MVTKKVTPVTEAAKETVKAVKAETAAKPAEATAAQIKAPAVKKATEKKTPEKKAPAKKTATKKTTTKKTTTTTKKTTAKKEIKVSTFVQYFGKQVEEKEIIDNVKKSWTDSGKKAEDIKTMELYIKPEENVVYYVVNETERGSVEF